MKNNSVCLRTFTLVMAMSSFSLVVNAQQSDSLKSRSARESGILSINGTTTYDGGGAGTTGGDGSYFGHEAGAAITTGSINTFIGAKAGKANTTGYQNTFVGAYSGSVTVGGYGNSFLGAGSGSKNTSGSYNTFLGLSAGNNTTTGSYNVFVGPTAGSKNTTGQFNTYLGMSAGFNNLTGSTNTLLGMEAGYNSTGSGNVFIGYRAGYNETGNNKLYIASTSATQPLIYGDFAANKLIFAGKTAIATTNFPTTVGTANVGTYNLFVKGGILTDEIRVRTGWADYVFQKNYQLKSLNEVERFINTNGHLPNVPSANEVEGSGLDLGDIARIQQEKIEELTLYIIKQNKDIEQQKEDIKSMKEMIKTLMNRK